MRCLIIAAAVGAATAGSPALGDEVLQPSLQNASTSLPDSAAKLEMANQLVIAVDSHPRDSLAANALFQAMQIYDEAGECDLKLAVAQRIVTEYPASPEAKPAFEFVWLQLTDRGANPLAGAQAAFDYAETATDPAESEYAYLLAYTAYLDAEMWNLASDAGCRMIAISNPLCNPELAVAVSGICLKAGQSQQAIDLLSRVIAEYTRQPPEVLSRSELGLIYRALGDHALAEDHFSRAWTTYQKMRKKPGFDNPLVRRAAARALWEMMEWDRQELEHVLDGTIDLKARVIRKSAGRLESGYKLIGETEPLYKPQSLIRIGDLNTIFAEARLREGYERSIGERSGPGRNPYDKSMPEYKQAIESYTLAWTAAEDLDVATYGEHWSEGPFDWHRQAVMKIHSTYVRQSEVVYDWSADIWKYAPTRGFGVNGHEQRFNLLAGRVIPLIRESLVFRNRAIHLALRNEQIFDVAETKKGVEYMVKKSADALQGLCKDQWNSTRATATQIAKTLQITREPATVQTLRGTLEQQMEYSDRYWKDGMETLVELYEAYLTCDPTDDAREEWKQNLMAFSRNYADLSRKIFTSLEQCTVGLDSYDPIMRTLKSRLRSLAARAERAEKESLKTAFDIAEKFEIHNDIYAVIYDRLREINPARYPMIDAEHSAQR